MLGARIAHHLLETEDVALRLLVRPASLDDPGKRSGLERLVGRGAEADGVIASLGIERVHVLTGAFLDTLATGAGTVEFDGEAGIATFWGTGEERFDATTVDDTARYAARVAVDPSVPFGKFAVAGQQLSLGDIVSAVERGIGRRYERRSRGTTDDLRAWISDRREAGETTAAMYGTYQLYMLTGQTALDDLQNDRYPDIEPMTLAQLSAE